MLIFNSLQEFKFLGVVYMEVCGEKGAPIPRSHQITLSAKSSKFPQLHCVITHFTLPL